MEHLNNEQIIAFLLFLTICIVLAVIGGAKQKRPTIPHNDFIREVVENCANYGVSVREFGYEANSEKLNALYHQGYTPIEAIQEFKKESINKQNEEA